MNYDKWNKMDLDGEDDEVGADEGAEVKRLKAKADAMFEANETSVHSMPVSYKECIACCFLRESEWLLAIKHGQIAHKLCTEEHWNEKLRARYFELHALYKYFHHLDHAGRLTNHAQLITAEEHVAEMKKLLQFHAGMVSPEHLSDYEEVFHQLAQCIAKVDKDIASLAESHFEKAQQLQRMHQVQEALTELAHCLALTLQLRTAAHLSTAAKINIQIAVTRDTLTTPQRDLRSTMQNYTAARDILLSAEPTVKTPILLAAITAGISLCALKQKQVSLSHTAELFQSVCAVAERVFDNTTNNTTADDANVAFLAHLLTPNAHIIDKSALFAHHSPHVNTTQYTFIQHLLRCCNILADLHAAQGEWELCNEVTDRTIDICNALIAQFAPVPTTTSTTTAVPHIVTLLQRRRAECFLAKAMMYKDHPLFTARIGTATEASADGTTTDNSGTNATTTTTASTTAATSYTWPSCIPLLNKHSVPTEYNEYATFHRLRFDSVSEAVAVLLQVAGSEYEKIDAVQSMRTFHTLAEYTMNIAQIQPFDFSDAPPKVSTVRLSNTGTSKNATAFTTTSYAGEIITTTTTTVPPASTASLSNSNVNANAVDKKDLAEKAADAWVKVSLQATRQVDIIQTTLNALLTPSTAAVTTASATTTVTAVTVPYAVLRTHYFEKYFYLQQSMLAMYYAGVCAFHFDVTLSQRNFESAEEVRQSIDALLTGELKSEFNLGEPDGSSSPDVEAGGDITNEEKEVKPTDASCSPTVATSASASASASQCTSAEARSLHGYYATCGDLSYHLSQAYLRLTMYSEALQAATSALAYYEHSERLLYLLNTINQYNNAITNNTSATSPRTPTSPISPGTMKNTKSYHSLLKMGVVGLVIPLSETTPTGRLRQRLCLTVCALCHSARGELKLVEQAVRRVGDLCLGPIEDAASEMAAVRKQLSQQQHSIQQEMSAGSHIPQSQSRKKGYEASVPAAIAIDGNKVSNSVMNYDSDEDAHSGARFKSDEQVGKNEKSGISNVRVEKVPVVKKKMDFNLLIAYSIVSIVVVAIVVGIYWK